MEAHFDPGSFRDPRGHVFQYNGSIYRTINESALADYTYVRDSGLLTELEKLGWIVTSEEVDKSQFGAIAENAAHVVKHNTIPFVSYPYEWTFPLLKAAALLHLDLQLKALDYGITSSDATAYNVQFIGSRPTFIDLLSLRRYNEGEVWAGHRQFCEQFLNPLLMNSLLGLSHNAWFRGTQEGINALDFSRLLRFKHKLSFRILSHVTMQARLQQTAIGDKDGQKKAQNVKLSKQGFKGMLTQLRDWIAGLQPAGSTQTVWGDYEESHTYSSEEEAEKHAFIKNFCATYKPDMLWDIGCNTGEYSEAALEGGATRVIGFDFDQHALARAYARAQAKNLNYLPLFQDASNPTPDQGWRQQERQGLQTRAKADAIVALAFIHHLAIAKNIPLDQLTAWLTGFAPIGIIEFVHKSDPTVREMLMLREDIFEDYSEENFEKALLKTAEIVDKKTVSSAGRTLYIFKRH